ncbi:2-dehydro-3-deoxygluconokinase [Evansella caseinilytica]|uniref:2-dehydro-3-deoxygluconokinase n=1 Tax=Evansella caseinilytica TaxID=1503961 RepID=A0A1H3UX04_9BACI|nr:sugar kinase [Evansella caseinilytica]SDZ66887.1 2-dehydro-3-deoxygluconokinase [Evansella caseinilytica]
MFDVLTIGDGMITMDPKTTGPMRFVNEFQRKVGGAELNFAIGTARLGLKTGWLSRLGNDEFGRYIYNFIRGEGIDVSEVKLVDHIPTSVNFKEIMEDGQGRTFYYRNPSPISTLTTEDIKEEHIKQFKVLHITGVFMAIDPKNPEIIEQAVYYAKKHGLLISMDPNIRLRLWSKERAREVLTAFLPQVDVLLTGDEEGDILLDTKNTDELVREFQSHGIGHVVVKKGGAGALAVTANESISMPAFPPRKVVDTVGAGDGFDAGFITGLLKGWPLERTLRFANKVGSIVVSVKGDNEGLPYYEDVLVELGERESIER